MVNIGSVHNEFDFFLSRGLELKNASPTARVLGSNLTGLFFQLEIFRSKNCLSAYDLSAYVLS